VKGDVIKIWQEITKKIEKKDLVYWFIILGWTFVLVVLGMYINPESQILSRMGTLVSIILAMVAIFYAIVQGVTSQQNIGTMHNIMDNVKSSSQAIEATAHELLYQTSGIRETQSRVEDNVQKLMELSGQEMLGRTEAPGIPKEEELTSNKVEILLKKAPVGVRVGLYRLVMTKHSTKESSLGIITKTVGMDFSNKTYLQGWLECVAVCLPEWQISIGDNVFKASNLPANFEDSVKASLIFIESKLLELKVPGFAEAGKSFEASRKAIEEYFAD